MSDSQDKLNWIKNLIQIMCCDREIADPEKKFLFRAAKELQVEVKDWNGLLKLVLKDDRIRYPVQDRKMALATLKSLVVMAKADGRIDKNEKHYILRFAKLIGLSNSEFKQIVRDIDVENLFRPFRRTSGGIIALKEDFEHLEKFVAVAEENDNTVHIAGYDEFVRDVTAAADAVCFHAAADRHETVDRCRTLLDKSGDRVVSILSRHQGYQVKYLLEMGLRKCIIEPVYAKDIHEMFAPE
jgi:uncharacterized tellurite resistance protein B-like protein